jgi:hypothetical protein
MINFVPLCLCERIFGERVLCSYSCYSVLVPDPQYRKGANM